MKSSSISQNNFFASLTWKDAADFTLILFGSLLQALALRLFLIPAQLASGGISGLAQIINNFTSWPVGMMIFLGNLPMFIIGWRYLGGPRFLIRTVLAVVIVSIMTDFLALFIPAEGVTHDLVLNSLYGGIVSGIGFGLVYRGQGTSGGSDILTRILNHWRGIPISTSYLITDALIVFLAGLAFNWEKALYALVMLYVSGLAAEAVTEGMNVVRTALIVTAQPDQVVQTIMLEMDRGVTLLEARGGYTGAQRTVLYIVISRSEVVQLKSLVHQADPQAFMVIGHGHEALGEGFRPLKA